MTETEILKGSFLKFIWYLWTRVLRLPEPTRVQKDIAKFMETGPRKRFISAFRGVGKTFLVAAYCVWRLWNNPNLKIVIVSANEDFATEIATFIKMLIHADPLWGELRTKRNQRSSARAFEVGAAADTPDKSPSVKAVGITGQITGSRSDLLISDDVEVPKNSATESMRELLKARTKEYADIAKVGSEIIYLGTPQTQESIYRDLPSKGYDVRIWPARYPDPKRIAGYRGTLAPLIMNDLERNPDLGKLVASSLGGAPTDPNRFNEEELMNREMEHSSASFLLQYQLDTSLSDGEKYPLKTKDLIVTGVSTKIAPVQLAWGSSPDQVIKELSNVGFDGDRFHRPMFVSPEFVPYTGSVMHIDPSGRGKDETAYCVTKFLNGFIYLTRWGGFRDGYGVETLTALAEISKEEEVNLIMCEDNMGDGMFRRLLEPVVAKVRPCPVDGYKVSGQKEARIIAALQPILRQHRLVVSQTVVEDDLRGEDLVRKGFYQLTHMTNQRGALKHDDRVDVLAAAARHWADYLNADAQKALEDHRRKEEEKWEREFFSGNFVGLNDQASRRRRVGRPMGRSSKNSPF